MSAAVNNGRSDGFEPAKGFFHAFFVGDALEIDHGKLGRHLGAHGNLACDKLGRLYIASHKGYICAQMLVEGLVRAVDHLFAGGLGNAAVGIAAGFDDDALAAAFDQHADHARNDLLRSFLEGCNGLCLGGFQQVQLKMPACLRPGGIVGFVGVALDGMEDELADFVFIRESFDKYDADAAAFGFIAAKDHIFIERNVEYGFELRNIFLERGLQILMKQRSIGHFTQLNHS